MRDELTNDDAPAGPVVPRVALVTGGAGPGIGSAISRALAASGHEVWVVDKDVEQCEAVVAEIGTSGGTAVAAPADVADDARLRAIFAALAAERGVLHALVNSAADGSSAVIADATDDQWQRVMDVDLRAAFVTTRAAIPLLRAAGGGAVVNISSVHGRAAERGSGIYATAKAALIALSRATARDHGVDGIRCNAVLPGAVPTPKARESAIRRGEDPDGIYETFLRHRQMLPRLIQPADIANAVAFLVSDAAACITGTELVVDAGLSGLLWDADR